MVEYLLDKHPQLSNTPDSLKNETPIFYVLSKHKDSQTTRLALVDLFIKRAETAGVDLGHRNTDGKTCYEAYATNEVVRAQSSEMTDVAGVECTGASVDPASQLVEKKHAAMKQIENVGKEYGLILRP